MCAWRDDSEFQTTQAVRWLRIPKSSGVEITRNNGYSSRLLNNVIEVIIGIVRTLVTLFLSVLRSLLSPFFKAENMADFLRRLVLCSVRFLSRWVRGGRESFYVDSRSARITTQGRKQETI